MERVEVQWYSSGPYSERLCFVLFVLADIKGESANVASNDVYLLSCLVFIFALFFSCSRVFPPRRPYDEDICKVISGALVRLTTCGRSTNSLPKLSFITPVSSSSSYCFVYATAVSFFPSPAARGLFLWQPFWLSCITVFRAPGVSSLVTFFHII